MESHENLLKKQLGEQRVDAVAFRPRLSLCLTPLSSRGNSRLKWEKGYELAESRSSVSLHTMCDRQVHHGLLPL